MLHIGMITADLSHKHGWAHYSLALAQALARAGAKLTLVTAQDTPPHPDLNIHPMLPRLVPPAPLMLPRLLLQTLSVRRVLRACDAIHCTVEPFAPLAWAVRQGRPMFQGGVGSYLHVDRWQRAPFVPLYRRAFNESTIIAISQASGRVAQANFPHARVAVVPLGIDAARFTAIERQPRADSTPLILSVGGVKPRKGTLYVVRAMAAVREHYPDARLVVLGNTNAQSAYTRQVMAEIERLNLHDYVDLRGFVSDAELLEWYGRADIFAMPSMNDDWRFEGFGLVHLEASAAGLPVIGSRDTGNEDAVAHGVTGYLVSQAGIDDELPRYLLTLLDDPALRERMGQEGRARATRQTWDSVAQQYLAIYESALQNRERR